MTHFETTTPSPAEAQTVVGEFPCSQTQIRCWILDQLKPGNPALNVAVRWEIRGAFRASTIDAAFRKIIERHEVLRTCFVERNGEPRQQVVDKVDFKMAVIDLRNIPPEQRQKRILEIGEETASEPFDLHRPCLFRVSLLMVANDSAYLLITAHQSCFDGYSIRVLGRELGEIAASLDAERLPVLPELPLQYGDFAMWQEEYLASYGFEAEKEFWLGRLKNAPYFEIAPDKTRGGVKSNRGNIKSVVKAGDFGDRMDAAARENKLSVFSYGAAVASAMLYGLSQNTPVLFGSQVAGRESSELENMIGVFINNVVMRFDLTPETLFSEHLHNAGGVVTDALNNQNMPFNKLVEALNPPRDPSRNPVISVNFNCQKAFLEDAQYGGFKLISAPSQSPGVIYDLSFMMVGRPSGWRLSIEYNADLFEVETIEQFLELWQSSYELALSRPDARIADFLNLAENLGCSQARRFKSAPQVVDLSGGAALGADKPVTTTSFEHRLQMLIAIWSDVLPNSGADAGTNFFQAGGHSLLALRMISKVRETFGVKPDLELLFRKPILKEFAEAIFDTAPIAPAVAATRVANPWELTAYKQGDGPLSIYTLNHPFLFFRLAEEISDDISVYNVNLFGAPKGSLSERLSLGDFASQAIETMNLTKDSGPVVIMGLCVNGVLAIEIGRQLKERGIDLRLTAAIDSWAPGYFRSLPKLQQLHWNTERRVKRIAYFTHRLLRGRIKPVDYLKAFNLSLSLMKLMGIEAGHLSKEEEANAAVTGMLVQATRSYKVKPINAPVILFRSRANHQRANKLLFGWRNALPEGTEVYDIEGWHEDSLTQGGIAKLASLVSDHLDHGIQDHA